MKHLFLLCILLLNVVTVSGQSLDSLDVQVSEVVEEIKSEPLMNKVYDDVKEALVGLSGALKVGTEHVYKVLVRQQIVNSFVYLSLGLISMLLIISFIKSCKSDEEWLTKYDIPKPLGFIRVAQGIIGVLLCVNFLFDIDVILTGFINPEYGALNEIVNWVR